MEKKAMGTSLGLVLALMAALSLLTTAGSVWAQGKAAPDFTLKDIQGKDYSLSQYKGKVVVLNFYTIWCMPCREEMPVLNEIYKEYKDKGVQMLGVCLKPDPNQFRALVKILGLDYPMLAGTEQVDQAYGSVAVVPTTFIIDKQGKIAQTIEGARKKDTFVKAIQPLL